MHRLFSCSIHLIIQKLNRSMRPSIFRSYSIVMLPDSPIKIRCISRIKRVILFTSYNINIILVNPHKKVDFFIIKKVDYYLDIITKLRCSKIKKLLFLLDSKFASHISPFPFEDIALIESTSILPTTRKI